MTRRNAIVSVLLAFVVMVFVTLARGARYLETLLPGGLPLGNALVALGLCAMAGAAVVLSVRGSALRAASIVALVGAALWLPMSIALAGNLELNFGDGRGAVWLAFSVAVLAAACVTLLWALGAAALARHQGSGAAT